MSGRALHTLGCGLPTYDEVQHRRRKRVVDDGPGHINQLRAIAAGAQGYICKPFTAEQVKVRVLPLLRAA